MCIAGVLRLHTPYVISLVEIKGVPMTTFLQSAPASRVRCPKCNTDVEIYSFCKTDRHEIAGYKFRSHSYKVNVEHTSGGKVESRPITLSCRHTDQAVEMVELQAAIERKIAFPIVVRDKPLPAARPPINGRSR